MNLAARKSVGMPLVVLVLEDEPLIAMDLQFAFEDHGVEVHVATSCGEACALLETLEPDGAVLDVNLGHGATCERVATILRSRGVPFILHTGDLNRRGETIGKLDAIVVPKPTPAAQVAQTILDHMGQRTG